MKAPVAKTGPRRIECCTYVVEMRFHVDESQGLLKEDYEHPWGNSVLVEPVLVHVRLLGEGKRSVFETYTDTVRTTLDGVASATHEGYLDFGSRHLAVWAQIESSDTCSEVSYLTRGGISI